MTAAAGHAVSRPSARARGRSTQIATRKRDGRRARTPRRTPISARCAAHELVFARARPAPARPISRSAMPSRCSSRARSTASILSRPAVEAGERLGFLPGDMREKVDPYLRPLYDALYDHGCRANGRARPADRHDRDRAARLHARPHACQRRRPARRGAERDADADEDVPDPARRGLAHDRHRRSDPDRPAAGPEVRPGRGDRRCSTGVEGIARRAASRDGDVVRHDLVRRIVARL